MTFSDYDKDTQWVHEADYGEPAFGMILVGLFEIVAALVLWVVSLFSKERR